MSLLGSFFGRKPGASAAPRRGGPFLAGLASYPPWQLPFPGPSSALRDDQLDANLAWFLDHRAQRLAAVTALLDDCGVDSNPLLDSHTPPTLTPIQAALERELPERSDLPAARDPAADFRAHGAIGPRIFYAFGADLGVLIGEAIMVRRPGRKWAIARDRADIGMPHYRAITLVAPPTGEWPETAFDMLGATIESLYELRRNGVGLRPDLSELLTAHL